MRADLVVLPEPAVDDDLGLFGGREPLGIQNFASEGSVEARVVAVLPE